MQGRVVLVTQVPAGAHTMAPEVPPTLVLGGLVTPVPEAPGTPDPEVLLIKVLVVPSIEVRAGRHTMVLADRLILVLGGLVTQVLEDRVTPVLVGQARTAPLCAGSGANNPAATPEGGMRLWGYSVRLIAAMFTAATCLSVPAYARSKSSSSHSSHSSSTRAGHSSGTHSGTRSSSSRAASSSRANSASRAGGTHAAKASRAATTRSLTTRTSTSTGKHTARYSQAAARDPKGRIARSPAAKHDFQKSHPCPSTGNASGACPGYVIDHVTPLKRGGADKPGNMQWQTKQAAKEKDRTE